MIFIGGVDAKQSEIGQFDSVLCPHCQEKYPMTLYKTYYFFHVFFLPIFKWNLKYLLTCHGCHAILVLASEKGKALEKGYVHDVDIADLTVLEAGEAKPSRCESCQCEVDAGFKFCPHCGVEV